MKSAVPDCGADAERSREMKHRVLAGSAALATASLTLIALGASASEARPVDRARGPNSFGGTCRVTGELVFDTPLGSDLRTTTLTDSGTGTCTGKLNGVRVRRIPVVNR